MYSERDITVLFPAPVRPITLNIALSYHPEKNQNIYVRDYWDVLGQIIEANISGNQWRGSKAGGGQGLCSIETVDGRL